MPLYYFNVVDGKDIVDTDGTELAGLDEARTQAIMMAGEMLKDYEATFWRGELWQMNVLDEAGLTVCRLNFSAEKLC